MKGSNLRIFFSLVLLFSVLQSLITAHENSSYLANPQLNATDSELKDVTKSLSNTKRKIFVLKREIVKFSRSVKEEEILNEINVLRESPLKYVEYLENYRSLFKGNVVYVPGEPEIESVEGVAAVDESIAFLKSVAKIPPYTMSKGLSLAANLQLKDLMEDSSIGHKGKNGSTLSQRLEKFGYVGNAFAENISFYAKTPREVVMTMLIDDGVKSRNHRKNLFSTTFKQIGLAFGDGKNGELLCVIDFADSFRDK